MLEEPEQASNEPLDDDKKHEPPVSPKAEKSLVYAVPCKKKTAKKSESGSSKLDGENKKIEDVCLKDEDSNEMLDPSVFAKVGENPANALPGEKETAKKAESACNELDEEKSRMDDVCPTDEDPSELLDPSPFLEMEDNPSYALPWKKKTDEEVESACCELNEKEHQTDDTRL